MVPVPWPSPTPAVSSPCRLTAMLPSALQVYVAVPAWLYVALLTAYAVYVPVPAVAALAEPAKAMGVAIAAAAARPRMILRMVVVPFVVVWRGAEPGGSASVAMMLLLT